MDPDLFISYQSSDAAFAKELAEAVERVDYQGRKLRAFFAPWEIGPGYDIVAKIDEGLAKSRFVALILSPDYLKADWPTAERHAAVFRDPAGRLGRVIPIRHRPCTLPPLLSFIRYLDFENDKKAEMERLIAVLTGRPLPRGQPAGQPGTPLSDQEVATQHLAVARADQLHEEIYPNIFAVIRLPKKIWSAPTPFRYLRDISKYFGTGGIVPANFIADGRLYTFANLSKENHAFTGITDDYDPQAANTDDWMNDPVRRNRLVWLLNDCLRVKTRQRGMTFDPTGKKYYYREGVLKDLQFKAYGKGKPKGLILDYSKAGYKAHRAAKLRFERLGHHAFLKVEAAWVFLDLGGILIEGRRRIILNAKFVSTQRNAPNLGEVRFWPWFFSDDKDVIRFEVGDETVEVESLAIPIQMGNGIFGDQSKLTPVVEPPELVFDAESDESEDEEEPDESG